MTIATLKSIEDKVHSQLVRMQRATAQDASLKPLHDQLLAAWSALYSESRRRALEEASKDGGDEEIVTVFSTRPNGGITETRICRRIVMRRYSLDSFARWFVDVADASTPEKLSYQMRKAA